jgi:two-component system, cell cycle sensor histidine kinase and response regulator CckA
MATILVVDDRADDRQLLATLLDYYGHRVLEATDGAEALQIAQAERPDLIISDILMPTMDGYEFVRRLRADPDIAKTAVLVFSAHRTYGWIGLIDQLGVDGFSEAIELLGLSGEF